jgi:hypothetical protein
LAGPYHFALCAARERLPERLQMSVSDLIAKIVSFLRAGYPQGVPAISALGWDRSQPLWRLGGLEIRE